MTKEHEELFAKIECFVRGAEDVRFLGLIGSSSNEGDLSDEYSDLDLVLVTDNMERYYSDDAWLSSIEEVWITFVESAPDINHWERRCIFRNGMDVDFIIVEKGKFLVNAGQFPVLKDVCRKTMRAILDKDNMATYFMGIAEDRKKYIGPKRGEYANLVNDFFFHYAWALKKCLRGEYWVALQCVNGYLKARTLTMIEWYEHAIHGNGYETYYHGRFLERWIDEPIRAEVGGIFSSYGKNHIINALEANRSLFARIAKEVGGRNGFEFPLEKVDALTDWAKKICMD